MRFDGDYTPEEFEKARRMERESEGFAREVAPCGCVAASDGTGIPCAEHHPDGKAPAGKREILVHLNVEVPASDERTADEIADALIAAMHIGVEGGYDYVGDLQVVCPLAEEV